MILAVDPGKLSGIALVECDPVRVAWSHELDWFDTIDKVNATLAAQPQGLTLVAEGFLITAATAKKTAAPWSLEALGAMRWLCYKYDVEFVMYTSGEAKEFSDNNRLRHVGLWHRGGAGHANDALRHAVLHLAKTQPSFLRSLV